MEYVKKAALGYRETAGIYDAECTHVILTKEEFLQFGRDVDRAKRECEEAIRKERSKVVQEIAMEHDFALDVKEQAKEEKKALLAQIEEAKAETAFQKGLNENLLRIARERANAERGLKPKKEHSGYCVLTSDEHLQRVKDRYGDWQEMPLWETKIQSPWAVEMPQTQVRGLLEREIQEGLGEILGIGYWFSDSYEKMLKNRDWDKRRETSNIALGLRLRADYGRGYWEFFLQHTKALENVPEELRKGKRENKE